VPSRFIVLSLGLALALVAIVSGALNSLAQPQEPETLTCIRDGSFQTTSGTPGPTDVRPPRPQDAQVIPASDDPLSSDGTFGRELYLAVITLPPGECVPFEVTGNQRDGAVIWLVQQGVVHYAWRPVESSLPGATPEVEVGDNIKKDGAIAPLAPRRLYPGDWVTQNRQIEVTYTNIGGESAVLVKAVFAKPEFGGCRGGCK